MTGKIAAKDAAGSKPEVVVASPPKDAKSMKKGDGKPDAHSTPGFNAIIEELAKDAKLFPDEVARSDFLLFARRLSVANHLKIFSRFENWEESYEIIDPDANRTPEDKLTPAQIASEQKHRYAASESFLKKLYSVMKKAEFRPLSHEMLFSALQDTGDMGLIVVPPNPRRYSVWLFVRGNEKEERLERHFKHCFMQTREEFDVYDRLLVVFRVEDEGVSRDKAMSARREELMKERLPEGRAVSDEERAKVAALVNCRVEQEENDYRKQVKREDFMKKLELKKASVKALEAAMRPGFLYLKLFKDVPSTDLDFMVPMTDIKLTWFDKLLIVVPIAVGILTTLTKIFRGGLSFQGANNALQSIILCLGPLIYGAKAYMNAMQKKENYRADLTNIYRLHNVSNNSGVIASILDEAQDMDDHEALLAWYTLRAAGRPLTRPEVDKIAEAKLRALSGDEQMEVQFDVPDALEKLREFGLVRIRGDRINDPDRCTYEALPLLDSIKVLSEPNKLLPWNVPEDDTWSMCTEFEPETGKQLRYRFNRKTKETVVLEGPMEGVQAPIKKGAQSQQQRQPQQQQQAQQGMGGPGGAPPPQWGAQGYGGGPGGAGPAGVAPYAPPAPQPQAPSRDAPYGGQYQQQAPPPVPPAPAGDYNGSGGQGYGYPPAPYQQQQYQQPPPQQHQAPAPQWQAQGPGPGPGFAPAPQQGPGYGAGGDQGYGHY